MAQGKGRQSGIEVLRIIAMLLIIAHHYSVHGGYEALTVSTLTPGRIFLQFLMMFGRPSCSVFVLISGFFMIDVEGMRAHYKKLGPFCGTMVFYGLAYLLLCFCLNIHVSRKALISSVLPFAGLNWFAVYYIALFILVPFINPMLKHMTRRRFSQFILILLVCWSILPSLRLISSGFSRMWNFGSIGFFLTMYCIGAYLRLHVHGKLHYDNRWNLVIALTSTVLILLGVLGIDLLASVTHRDSLLSRIIILREYDFPLSVIWAISLFLYFSNLKFSSPVVNRIAPACFGVYLIHDHPAARDLIWRTISPNANYVGAPYLHALIKIPAVFTGCAIIELLRGATVGKWFDRIFSKVYDRCLERLDMLRLKSPPHDDITDEN